jgi:hypothetical protein
VKVDMPPIVREGPNLEGTVMTEDGSLFNHIVAALIAFAAK